MSSKDLHFILTPSGAHQWGRCAGSVKYLYETFLKGGDETSEEAAEGTFAHDISAFCLINGVNPDQVKDKGEISQDMQDHIQKYIDYCRSFKSDFTFVEERLDLNEVYGLAPEDKEVLKKLGLGPEPKGISDFITFTTDGVLYVIDLKYGRGVEVFAEDNPQEEIYGSGAVKMVEDTFGVEIKTVCLIIYQPRIKNVPDRWSFPRSHIDVIDCNVATRVEMAMTVLKYILRKKEIPQYFFEPSDEACRFCTGNGKCRAKDEHCARELEVAFDSAPSVEEAVARTADLSDEEIAKRLPALDMVKKLVSALWSEAHSRMMNGRKIPGYKLVEGRKGNRNWADEKFIIKELKRMKFKDDEIFDKKVRSPTKIEEVCKKKRSKLKWKKLTNHITRNDASLTIVPESDPRDDRSPATIDKLFDNAAVED